ncbi:MAG: glycoside hydrolase family 97 catalytic domain-containing protein [Planctomycetota bacterium]
MILVRSAPLPHARPASADADGEDLAVAPGAGGFDLRLAEPLAEWTRLPFTGGRSGATAALQAWQRGQRPDTDIHRWPRFIINTWGDRNRDSRITADFIRREIDAAARIGADAVQIDDGWQHGRSHNSATPAVGIAQDFRATDPAFWSVDPERFPQGLEPLVEHARRQGVEIALWFAPDRADGHRHWRQDVDTLLALHRRYGIRLFKIDFVDTSSAAALANFTRLAEAVRRGSVGAIALEIDCTAGRRPGYFGVPDAAPLFIENRYTDWSAYWPHQTLRNLWSLARWVDPLRVRMEFLNPRRNAERYGDDPLAPQRYTADALLATVLAANPLGWFEASQLDEADVAVIAALAQVWRQHRRKLAELFIEPVGRRPDGTGVSGFRWWHPERQHGYLLLLRGIGGAASFVLAGCATVEHLAGAGSARIRSSNLQVEGLPERGYLLLRWRV